MSVDLTIAHAIGKTCSVHISADSRDAVESANYRIDCGRRICMEPDVVVERAIILWLQLMSATNCPLDAWLVTLPRASRSKSSAKALLEAKPTRSAIGTKLLIFMQSTVFQRIADIFRQVLIVS